MIEREGEREAERLVAMGATLARSGGWDAEPLVKRTWAAEGLGLAQLAEQRHADLVVAGSRGLGGTDAILGSVSELVVHHSANPVLVVPHIHCWQPSMTRWQTDRYSWDAPARPELKPPSQRPNNYSRNGMCCGWCG